MANKKIELGVNAVYDVRELSFTKKFILGLQHTFAMFGATILVPILTGLDVSTTLLTAGLGTLLFHFITGGKVPAFLGSSFAFLAGYATVAPQKTAEQLAMASGGVFVAGALYLVVAFLIKSFGVKRVMRYFPPVVTGPMIICIGLTLAPVAIGSASKDWTLSLIAIAVVVISNIWGKGMLKVIPILLGIFVTYLVALALGKVNTAVFSSVDAVSVPLHTAYFATFNPSAIIAILPIALATMMEHVGDVSALSATTGKNFIANPGLHRTLAGDGVATMFASFLGGPANTTYGENTSVLAITRVYDPRVVRYAALFAIVFSFFPIFAVFVGSIPEAIIGGVSLILYGMISSIGVRNVVENQVDLTKSRNLIVAAVILVTGLGFAAHPLTFSIGSTSITLSGLAIAALSGIFLNAILPGKDYTFSEEEPQGLGEVVSFSGTDTTYEGIHHRTEEDTTSKN